MTSVLDGIYIMMILGLFFAGTVFADVIFSEIEDDDKIFSTNQSHTVRDKTSAMFGTLDAGMGLLIVGLILFTVVSAFFIRTHPIFFIINLILLTIVIAMSPIVSNTFMGLYTNEATTESAQKFDVMTLVIGNLPIIFGAMLVFVIIALHSKGSGNI